MSGASDHRVTTLAALEALYGVPAKRSLDKETDRLTAPYRALIEASPFCVLATSGSGGLDCSPRGDKPRFVAALDDRTLALPDRRGNNRLDSLRNIIADPRAALLFLIPGKGETLRVNGRATITTDPALCERFAMEGKLPRSVLVIAIEAVYFQCARAILRSDLWAPGDPAASARLPTPGEMIKACDPDFIAPEYDTELPEQQRRTLY
jgi:uncharacterized protein